MKKGVLLFLFCFLFAFPLAAADYSTVDRWAIDAPVGKDESLKRLVSYLTSRFNTDEDKARSIFTWIIYHTDYDKYRYQQYSDKRSAVSKDRAWNKFDTGDIFETRIGACGDISDLFTRMALSAGLEAETISGYAGYVGDIDSHAWNAVKINGKWELLDVTWAMDGDNGPQKKIKSDSAHNVDVHKREQGLYKYRKKRKNRSIDEKWFFTDPRVMYETHKPNNKKWRLF